MKIKFSIPKLLFFVLVLSLSTMIYTSSFFNILYDRSFYEKFHEAEGTSDLVNNPTDKSIEVVSYLIGDTDDISNEIELFGDIGFEEEELDHLADVRKIVLILRNTYFVSFGLFFILLFGFILSLIMKKDGHAGRKSRIFFMKLQVYVVILSSLILVSFWALTTFAFNWSFNFMHKLLFPPGSWTFPSDSLSVILFPSSFYTYFMSNLIYNVLIFIAMLFVLFVFIYLLYRSKNKK